SLLEKEGILINHPYIKEIVFCLYIGGNKRKKVGFSRKSDREKNFMNFIYKYCDFENNEFNTEGYEVNQGRFEN
ncbi:MAG: hypothetical protein KKD38_06610, partial [Candidatus Delongbacteria bacterium]|nr:hypothetical protein [Candidatus Delongbacteria bacterium]